MTTPFLAVRDLGVAFSTRDGLVQAVDGLSFTLARGRTLGIVGESGSGKSAAVLALMGLHDRGTAVTGSVVLEGTELMGLPERELNSLRGSRMAMVFQDALSALSPFYTVGNQIAEGYRRHEGGSRAAARRRAVDLLGRVGIAEPRRRASAYAHELSGGMRQRVMIAMALACSPALLIADEPTTALDVTVQARILDLLEDLQRDFDSAIILVSHDLGVVSRLADEVLVMYAGRCVESGDVSSVLSRPEMPYTWGLLSSIPRLTGPVDAQLVAVRGTPPSLIDLPAGCAFASRCDHAWRVEDERCTTERPLLQPSGTGHAACHLDDVVRHRLTAQAPR